MARVCHGGLYGTRAAKYAALDQSDVLSTQWEEVEPRGPHCLFIPRDYALLEEYERGWKVTDIFPVHSVGIVTARDKLTIGWTAEEVWERVQDFARLPAEEARRKYSLGRDAQDWKVELAQEDLRKSGPKRDLVVPILYRPFDVRYTYYTGRTRGFICRPREHVMRHMVPGGNIGFCTTITAEIGTGWEHAMCSRWPIQHHTVSLKAVNYLFPAVRRVVSSGAIRTKRTAESNLGASFVQAIKNVLRERPAFGLRAGILVLRYVYAVLYSPTYRSRYAEFLKADFPRIPLTGDRDLFRALCRLGGELVALHLLESPAVERFITRYPERGDNEVAKGYPKYYAPGRRAPGGKAPLTEGRVYVNKTQYFEGVPPEV